MFTGLVQDIGTVTAVEDSGGGKRITIETGMDLMNVSEGASIACSGCCLTVISKEKKYFKTDISNETLRITIINEWRPGTRVNLEPSLQLGDELGGHFVFGHVDGVAEIIEIKKDGDSISLMVEAPAELAAFIAPKGSISLDGVSLTVNSVEKNRFTVNIIPHTARHTTLGFMKPGDSMNIEIDMLARYVARMLNKDAA